MPGSELLSSPRVELRGVRKAFGACVANDGVSFSVEGGSIHAIVGENGAGKSTAMKILYGQYAPDEGEILLGGKPVRWRSPRDAIAAGLGMVHQHFMLAGRHDAVDNVLLAAGGSPFAPLGRRMARERLTRLMGEFGMEARLDLPVEELSVGEQQRVEILKLLYRDSRVLILDEPTAVLSPLETETLFATLRGMAERGKTILIITHKLREVMALASKVTVFRAGRVSGERLVSETSARELATLMVGREAGFQEDPGRPAVREELVAELDQARPVPAPGSRLASVSFRLRAGEILGVAGVEGNGQTELVRMLIDPASHLASGTYRLHGRDVSRASAGSLRRGSGLALLPEDRLREALLLGASVEENFLLGRQRSPAFRRLGGRLDPKALRAAVLEAIREFGIRPADPIARAGDLSGGNQQKLVVARELSDSPRFLLAAQPTRGVDIGAVEQIHERLLALRAAGAGLLLISSELEEVLKLSDRVLVLYRGRVVGSFLRGAFDERAIGLLMATGSPDRSAG